MIVNKASVDWLTLSSYEWTSALDYIENWYAIGGDVTKRMQYNGLLKYHDGGSVFVGIGKQKGQNHWLVQVSGDISDEIFDEVAPLLTSETITRIDIQLTVEANGWNQLDYMREAEAKGLKPTNARSPGMLQHELMTVYTGTRGSGRLNRLYEKEGEDKVYIRFETEFGRQYAGMVGRSIASGTPKQLIINGEVERKKIEMLDVFRVGEGKELPKPDRKKGNGKTERWLLNTVLPALTKYVNAHDSDDAVIKTFKALLDTV